MTTTRCFDLRPLARRLAVSLFLLPVVGFAACSGVQVVSETVEPSAFDGVETYAWTSRRAPQDVAGRPTFEPELAGAAQERIDAALSERGWRKVREARADVLLVEHFFVETVERQLDPYFNYYSVQVDEVGRFALEVLDPGTDERVWIAIAESRLRTVGRGVGLDSVQWTESGEEPDWKLEKKVDSVLGRLPEGRSDR